MKNKTILIHVKSDEALNNYIELVKGGSEDQYEYSKEIQVMITEFMNSNWTCYLATIENFKPDSGIIHKVFCINDLSSQDMDIETLNSNISVMIIRNIGPIEKNYDMIQNYLQFIVHNYKGLALNNPKAMLKGMSKNYLVDIKPDDLANLGVITIPTRIFSTSVHYDEIQKIYGEQMDKYLIKPLSGELSNSLKCLSDIDEDFFRHKENKVQGWIIQPIQPEIWDGEYQMVFLGKELIYAQSKKYIHDTNIPSQKTRKLSKYTPSHSEIDTLKKLINYFEQFYKIQINICRIDFMKNKEHKPILLEFEMVNPGFFIKYMGKQDTDISNIISSIRQYCENKLNSWSK